MDRTKNVSSPDGMLLKGMPTNTPTSCFNKVSNGHVDETIVAQQTGYSRDSQMHERGIISLASSKTDDDVLFFSEENLSDIKEHVFAFRFSTKRANMRYVKFSEDSS